MPVKLMEYANGYLLAGNIDPDRSIPLMYFIGYDLNLKKSIKYHFEPEHYKFKSSFRIKDIIYSQIQNDFITCGFTKISNIYENSFYLITDFKINDDFDTKLKMIKI